MSTPTTPAAAFQPPVEIQGQEDEKRLPIKTYHCRFCSHLLIASTRELLSSSTPLRRRRQRIPEGGGEEAGLDGALILELPSKTTRSHKKRKSSFDGDQSDSIPETTGGGGGGEITIPAAPQPQPQPQAATAVEAGDERKKIEQAHYTIPLSTLVPDSTPIVIRREDGFEKRVLLRCGRCRVIVGYKLIHNNTGTTAETEDDFDEEEEEDDEIGLSKGGKGDRAMYLLPGSIVGTQDLDVGMDGTGGGGDVLHAMIERNPVLKGMEGEWMEWVK